MRTCQRMALALIAAAWTVAAAGPGDWIPARWTGDTRLVEASSLELLRGTPINCLLMEWSGQPRERDFAKAARTRGIAVLGLQKWSGTAPAPDADLDGFALEGDVPAAALAGAKGTVIAIQTKMRAATGGAAIATAEAAWPRVRPPSDTAEATPSTEPWIDSNLWLVRVLRERAAGRPVWLAQAPEKPVAGDYERAVADAAAAGGQWVITFDADFRNALIGGQAAAKAQWRRIAAMAALHHDHPEWRAAQPVGDLAIVRDPAHADPDMADEYVNLIARRRVPFRLIDRGALDRGKLAGAAAALVAEFAPSAGERKVLEEFVRTGGALAVSSAWAPGEKESDTFREVELGKGRVAIYGAEAPDAETVSKDIGDVAGTENLTVRVFNAPSVLCHAASEKAGLTVQLINYASRPAEGVTLRARGRYAKVRLFLPGEPAREIPADFSGKHTQLRLPPVAIAAAVVFEP